MTTLKQKLCNLRLFDGVSADLHSDWAVYALPPAAGIVPTFVLLRCAVAHHRCAASLKVAMTAIKAARKMLRLKIP
jgi:hypothetical protein